MDSNTAQLAGLEHAEQLKRLYTEDVMDEMNKRLMDAMGELAGTSKGKMNFRGRSYATVALRVEMLRKHLGGDVSVSTEIVERNADEVVMKATIAYRGEVVATGYAEERRGEKGVNSTSALENCETSAVGRALAALGLGGGEYASADELTGAVSQQETRVDQSKMEDTFGYLMERFNADDEMGFAQAWRELDQHEMQFLWPRFNTRQKSRIREMLQNTTSYNSDEMKEAANG